MRRRWPRRWTAWPWRSPGGARGWTSPSTAVPRLFHLSRHASQEEDHVEFGTFPRGTSEIGLRVFVPTAQYMLALRLKAMRVVDPAKGPQETADIRNPMRVVGVDTPEQAVELMGRFFPRSASSPEKQHFLLRHVLAGEYDRDAPAYPVRDV